MGSQHGHLVPADDSEPAQQSNRIAVRLLGPLTVVVGGRTVELTTGRLRTLVAALALSAGQPVTVGQLATAVWGQNLPVDVRRTVSTYMARLRTALGAESIVFDPAGYVLRAVPDDVDLLRFDRLLDAAAKTADPARAAELVDEGLALWRGVPFEGVQSAWLETTEAPRVIDRYLSAVEHRVDRLITTDRAADLLPQLRQLTTRFPLRESLWARLLLVLDRCDRPIEALKHYELIRARIDVELGVDPGQELQRIHRELLGHTLVSSTAVRAPGLRIVPRQLPADVNGFAGRAAEVEELDDLIGGGDARMRSARIVVIGGIAGVGKTALAVHWAHHAAHRFPDGQLYIDLRSHDPAGAAMTPAEAMDVLLDSLQVPAQDRPRSVEGQAALYRSVLSGRCVLTVVDNARDADQVRPLLPGGPGCVAVVTARNPLTGIVVSLGARVLQLNRPTVEEARQLLVNRVGVERACAEPQAVAEIIESCARLPLALAQVAAASSERPLSDVAAHLREKCG
ncbi:AfsR/SARP family transcriptional regulator [Actinophytocola glycyrrhizae]|uniref:BTAD domain-containing putative transcriptional regulator n=1 Tax=Actinophytocola glycyrrhizae TaxID=2044873 RepID=A0ABV9S6H1_9PSEU